MNETPLVYIAGVTLLLIYPVANESVNCLQGANAQDTAINMLHIN